MRPEKFKFLALILIISLSFQATAQKTIELSKYNCFTALVKYAIEGQNNEGLLLFVNYEAPDMPALRLSNVYLLNKNGQNVQLVGDSNAFTSINDIQVSANSKYIALFMVGEGHPWIEIYDLQRLINERKQELLTDLNPYPGNINLVAWKNNELIVESDINLMLKNDDKDLTDTDIFDKMKKYAFDLNTMKYKLLK